jgi:hypothetical protein
MIDVDGATDFLLARGLIDVEAIVDGALTVRSAARRNRNLRVECPGGTGYLIKQPDASAQGASQTLRIEAAFYSLCAVEPFAGSLAGILPRLAFCDPGEAVLAVELYPDARPLWEDFRASDPPAIPAATCRAFGRALGTLHATFRRVDPGDPALAWFPRVVPWALSIHRPAPEMLADITPANYRTLGVLQGLDGLGPRLDAWRKLWRAETVVHGDIKSDNVLVLPPPGGEAGAPGGVRLVDWELAHHGDPAWDLAGALQDMLMFWTGSMPMSAGLTAEERVARAGYPLPAVQAALRAFWRGYRTAAAPTPDEARGLLQRAVAFSAARLIQSAYEFSQASGELWAQPVLWLQLAENLLADPALGQVQIYGIPEG